MFNLYNEQLMLIVPTVENHFPKDFAVFVVFSKNFTRSNFYKALSVPIHVNNEQNQPMLRIYVTHLFGRRG